MRPAEQGWLVARLGGQEASRASRAPVDTPALRLISAISQRSWRSIQSESPLRPRASILSRQKAVLLVLGRAVSVPAICPEGAALASAEPGGCQSGRARLCRRAFSRLCRMGREARPILSSRLPAWRGAPAAGPAPSRRHPPSSGQPDVPVAHTIGEERLPLAP